ncbi:DUF1763-domain-containing protein [Xylariaceae sp. FL0594]|nr:DUF1763-domain-containing protein [Xylariaceae sp. FL0594]
MADLQVIHGYRHLYRGLLRAVQYSKPARYTALFQLRRAFREEGATYDARGVWRTIRFLDAAARERGLEHRVLKNLLVIAWWRYGFDCKATYKKALIDANTERKKTDLEKYMSATAYAHYDKTIEMLNKSMGLCLR